MRQEEVIAIIRRLGTATQKDMMRELGIESWYRVGNLPKQLRTLRKYGILDCSEGRPRRWWVVG